MAEQERSFAVDDVAPSFIGWLRTRGKVDLGRADVPVARWLMGNPDFPGVAQEILLDGQPIGLLERYVMPDGRLVSVDYSGEIPLPDAPGPLRRKVSLSHTYMVVQSSNIPNRQPGRLDKVPVQFP